LRSPGRLRSSAGRRRSSPKGIGQASHSAYDEAQRTGDENPEQRALVRFRREDHRSEKSAAKPKLAWEAQGDRTIFLTTAMLLAPGVTIALRMLPNLASSIRSNRGV
jgi:hypothetical protein